MKPSVLLKTILDICFFLLLISFFSALFITAMTAALGNDFIPMELNSHIISEFTPVSLIVMVAELAIGGLLVYTIYVLRKLVRNFFKGKLYTRYQIASLNLIGQLIIIIILGQGVIDFITRIYFESQVGIHIGFSLTSFWFILAIGLFFIYLSKVFDNARLLKEDNELTV